MTRQEKNILRRYWGMPLRFMTNGQVLAKKGDAWGILYFDEATALENARILLTR